MSREMTEGQRSWGYSEGAVFSLALVCLGFGCELMLGRTAPTLVFPWNVFGLVALWCWVWWIYIKHRTSSWYLWLGGVRLAVCLLIVLFFHALIAGVVPQQDSISPRLSMLGLTHVTSSWSFVYVMLALLMNVAFASLRWMNRSGSAAVGFSLNHLGIWLVLAAGVCSAGDRHHVLLEVFEGQIVSQGKHRATEQQVGVPFSVELHDFSMEFFDPPILLIDATGNVVVGEGRGATEVKKGAEVCLKDWCLKVLEYYRFAQPISEGFLPADIPGAVSAALVKVSNGTSELEKESWISNGSFFAHPKLIELNDGYRLGLGQPQPRAYKSLISLKTNDRKVLDKYELQVNHPATYGPWKLYQLGYDESKGRWSNLSVIEAIYDPWLWFVYFGLLMMSLGTFYIVLVKAFR